MTQMAYIRFHRALSASRGESQVKRKKLLTSKTEPPEPLQLERERCMNPWNGRCANTEILLYIFYEGERLPICRSCWEIIASKDIEWRCN